ncbi:RHS repeat-associated core domain-containing protein, partial [Psychromicrobium sp. YIM B11713]|uniref:RHS repeat-associated core domain-containing protein n=1 Tax=Psychromicrobium sp. YIM B11713 TaxID=3145233 RepID=UPI00374FC13A
MDQGVTGSYDLCGSPAGQSFSISFGGRSGQVIKDAGTGVYKLQNDDNTKVEYLTAAGTNGTYDGGYWRLTDTSGTQYYFGLNKLPGWASGKPTTNSADTVPVGAAKNTQPCWNASFATSLCNQAYAWNLDYVVDLHGNSEAFYYAQTTNNYKSQAGSGALKSYVRSSQLSKVDYGMRSGRELLDAAPLHVAFDYTGRCTGVDCAKGSDIPAGFACATTGTCTTYSPTFYSDQRLLKVRAETLVAGAYVGADTWNLKHSFPDPGDGTKPALWLGSVDHQGVDPKAGTVGTISDPATVFSGQSLQNRVWVVDGLAPLDRYRISAIKTVTGASIAVTYTAAECTASNLPPSPQSNTKRCFPQWWAPTTPIAQPPRMDYFHIYPVASVSTGPGPGGDGSTQLVTKYQYLGSPAYKYAGPKYVAGAGSSQLTWSVFAGYGQVKVTTGNELDGKNPYTVTTYLRGLDGTPADTGGGLKDVKVTVSNGTAIDDSPWLAGMGVETQNYIGGTSTMLSSSISFPWASAPTATGTAATNSAQARHVGTGTTLTKSLSGQGGSGWLESKTTNTFDSYGRLIAASSTGNTAVSGDETCSVEGFADNIAKNILSLSAVASTFTGECSNGAGAGNLLKSARTLYDGSTSAIPGSAGYVTPSLGEAKRSDQAKSVSGQAATAWDLGDTAGYDALGRPTSSTDNSTGTTRTETTSYSPATGLPTSVTATNTLGWTQTTVLDPVRGQKLSETDPNKNASTYRYDASGRPTAMWDPLRPIANNPDPTVATSYSISQSAPSWVKTTKVTSMKIVSYKIYDGLGRLRQAQDQSPGGGTIATDAMYNSLGSQRLVRNKYYYTSEPDGTLKVPTAAVPSSLEYSYDGAGRPAKITSLKWDNQILWSTQASYSGVDTLTVTGPGNSQSAQSTVKDINGSVIKQLLYHGTTPTGTPDTTSYTFDQFKQMTGMKDAAGNQWSWEYDPLGRQVKAKDPDTGTSTTSFDNAGRTASTTNALGTATSYDYDALDRVTAVKIAASDGEVKTLLAKTYDGEKKGQPTSTTRFNGAGFDQAVKTSYSNYNAAYQAKTVTTELPGALGTFAGSYKTLSSYTTTGKLAQQKSPAIGGMAEELVGFGYDEWDQPTSVRDSGLNVIAGFTEYDHYGFLKYFQQLDTKAASNGPDTTGATETFFNWDATTGRLESQWSKNTVRGVISDLGKTSYSYDESGKITARENAFAARPGNPNDFQCYSYDYAGHLGAVWTPTSKQCDNAPSTGSSSVAGLGGVAPYAQVYSYNLSGDRSQVKLFDASGALAVTEDYNYPAAGSTAGHGGGPHQVQSVKGSSAAGEQTASFSWDAAGRMTDRVGQKLDYTLDGKLASTSGASGLPLNPNPDSSGGTPPGAADAGAQDGSRFYDGDGNLVGIVDGSGTTAMVAGITAHATTGGVLTATKSYSFAGKTVAQRTLVGGVSKLVFIIGDSTNTAQTLVSPTVGTGPISTVTRFTDPFGLARGSSQVAAGNGGFTAAPGGVLGVGSNAASQGGFGAVNGYIGGLADTGSALTHLGARELDPVLGIFTSPDPVLHTDRPSGFTPYGYSAYDPINFSDPSGLDWWGDVWGGVSQVANNVGNWVHDNAGTIANVATAVVVTVAVGTLATACVASVVCGIAVAVGAGVAGAIAGYAAG